MKQNRPRQVKATGKDRPQPDRPVRTRKTSTHDVKRGIGWYHWLFIAVIAIGTYWAYTPALKNQFLKTWDDPVYVTENKLLDSLSAGRIGDIFSFGTEFEKQSNNYHPLTTLSLAVNKSIAGLVPRSWYMTNILLHVLNTVLVYILVFLISGRRKWAALLAGLLFGLHPMHVESVAWISERKDVLYAFFFIAGLIAYYFHITRKGYKFLVLAFVLFVLSVLSKAMAVVFPVILYLIDILMQRKWSWKMALEKVPFFIISLIFGLLAVKVQSQGAMNEWQTFTFYQRVMHASYAFLTYLSGFVYPHGLSAMYPYPFINAQGQLPPAFHTAPFLFILILAVSVILLFMKNRFARVTGVGILFCFVTLVMVLQFISVGKAITADRYTYLPFIGLSLIPGIGLELLLENKRTAVRGIGMTAGLIMTVWICFFAVQTNRRIPVWQDDVALWTDALDQFPDVRMNFIRIKRGNQYFDRGEYREALRDYQKMAALDPKDDDALERIGRIYGQKLGQLDSALIYYNRAYALNTESVPVLKNLGVVHAIRNEFDTAMTYFLKAYAHDPADTGLILNIAATYRSLGNTAKAEEFDSKVK